MAARRAWRSCIWGIRRCRKEVLSKGRFMHFKRGDVEVAKRASHAHILQVAVLLASAGWPDLVPLTVVHDDCQWPERLSEYGLSRFVVTFLLSHIVLLTPALTGTAPPARH